MGKSPIENYFRRCESLPQKVVTHRGEIGMRNRDTNRNKKKGVSIASRVLFFNLFMFGTPSLQNKKAFNFRY